MRNIVDLISDMFSSTKERIKGYDHFRYGKIVNPTPIQKEMQKTIDDQVEEIDNIKYMQDLKKRKEEADQKDKLDHLKYKQQFYEESEAKKQLDLLKEEIKKAQNEIDRLQGVKVNNDTEYHITEQDEEKLNELVDALNKNTVNVSNTDISDQEDLINKPNHYHLGGYDIYEILQMKYGKEVYQGFCIGNILKYTFRHEHKGMVSDLKKARFNTDRLIESYEGKKYIPEYKQENND